MQGTNVKTKKEVRESLRSSMRGCERDSAGFEFGTEYSSYEHFGSIKSNKILISSVTGGSFKK